MRVDSLADLQAALGPALGAAVSLGVGGPVSARGTGARPLFGGCALKTGRVHEAAGPGGRAFAAITAGLGPGPVVWIGGDDPRGGLNPTGLARFLDPDRVLSVRCQRPVDVLWAMEEALRTPQVGTVVAELASSADLTASRRLQLAAQAGGALGLCLPATARTRATAAETRWRCDPAPPDGAEALEEVWIWRLMKTRSGSPAAWKVVWHGASGAVGVVSQLAGGPAPQDRDPQA